MFKHYAKITVRSLLRYKGHSLINLLGLALGMACCILLLLFLRDELAFDRFHANAEQIYRVTQEVAVPGQPVMNAAVTSPPLGPALRQEIPEVQAAARVRPYFEGSVPGRVAIRTNLRQGGDKQFYDRFFWVDPDLFRVLTYEWLEGIRRGR